MMIYSLLMDSEESDSELASFVSLLTWKSRRLFYSFTSCDVITSL